MPTAPSVPKAPKPLPRDQFAMEEATFGGVTMLTLHGTLNDAFDGRKLAETIRSKKVVVDLRDVRRFASWGMTEWMDFLRITQERDLYLVECSAYALSQINLVTGLLGHGKLVSYYASYRCGSCSEELETLFLVPRDRAVIRDLAGSYEDCTTCGGRAWLEEYPAAFFEMLAERPTFDIDDEVLTFLRSHFAYDLSPDLTRFRAFRRAHKTYTYLRLSGNIATLPHELLAHASAGTTIVDLERVVFDVADVIPWQTYVKSAMTKLSSLQLLNCPVGFLEGAVLPTDLRNKLKVRTFALPYECARCFTTTAHNVDVAENLEHLVKGTVPVASCPTCHAVLVASVSPELTSQLRNLPARDRDPALEKFLTGARAEPIEKLENCLIPVPEKPAKTGGRTGLYAALGVIVLAGVAGAAVVVSGRWNAHRDTDPVVSNHPINVVTPPPRLTFPRPDWVMSDVPSSAYCHDLINRLMCVGVSSYQVKQDDAIAEANDAALDELASSVGLKISDPFFRDNVVAGYSKARGKALSALQAADLDRSSDPHAAAAYVAANEGIRKARKRVAEALQSSGGAAVPTQRTDWHWEKYESESGKGEEMLVFVRYDITIDAMRALVEKYSETSSTAGTSAMTAFPELAWEYPDFTGGAFLTKVGKSLAAANIAPQQIVTAVGDQPVTDAGSFVKHLEEAVRAPGALKLTVKVGEAPARVVDLRH